MKGYLVWAVLALLGLGLLAWWWVGQRGGSGPRQPVLEFQQREGICNPDGREDEVFLEPGEGEIRFTGAIVTPNPCVTLEARVSQDGPKLTLLITSVARPGPCVDCLGRVEYGGSIELPPGEYTVEVLHEDRQIASQRITVR